MPETFQPCPNHKTNNTRCNCPKTECPNHGICCRCVVNHLNASVLPFCLRKAEV